MRYAQIDDTGFCFAESQLSGPVDDTTLIPLEDGELALGKLWIGSEWHDLPKEAGARHITVGAFLKRFGSRMFESTSIS